MKPGLDLLGMAHPRFPFKRILKEVPADTPIGFFWNTFGDSRPRFKKLIQAGFRTFRIQMYWDDNHKIVPMRTLRTELKKLSDVLDTAPDITVYISPSCEHAERDGQKVIERLMAVGDIRERAWKCDILPVNNPWTGAHVERYLREHHGSNPGNCDLASTDGTNIYDIDADSWVRRYRDREHPCFLWGARFNLREIGDPGQKPPPIAQRKAAPSLGYFRSILRLTHPKGEPPTPSFAAEKLQAPSIYKTHAEDDQEQNENQPDELRENRPVLIMQPHVPHVDILTHNGQAIGRLKYYGDFPGGLHRYYAGVPGSVGLYGYEIGNKAKAASGSEFVWFRAGRKIYGPVHPAFRAGTFRS